MKKRVVRLTEQDIENLVKKIIKENEFDWAGETVDFPGNRPPIKRTPETHKEFRKYCRGTKWDPCTRNGERYYDMYKPFNLYISGDDKIKIACVNTGGREICFDQDDYEVSHKKAAEMLGVSSLDVIGYDGIVTEGKKKEDTIHTKKWDRCVEKVKADGKSEESAYKICSSSIKNAGVKKSHQQKKGKQYLANRKKVNERFDSPEIDPFNVDDYHGQNTMAEIRDIFQNISDDVRELESKKFDIIDSQMMRETNKFLKGIRPILDEYGKAWVSTEKRRLTRK